MKRTICNGQFDHIQSGVKSAHYQFIIKVNKNGEITEHVKAMAKILNELIN